MMKVILGLALALGACSHSSQDIVENDEHPFSGPVLATFSSLAYTPRSPSFKSSLTRMDVRLPGFRKSLPLWYWEAPKAPLLFILLPGFGSSPDSLTVQATAESLWLQGFSVLSLPSNTHALFAQAASSTRRPGYLPRDLMELRSALLNSVQALRGSHKRPIPDRMALAGLSYGALQSILWSSLQPSQDKESLNFEAYVALSPPIDLSFALNFLDEKFDMGQRTYLDSLGHLQPALAQKIAQVESRSLLIPEILGAFETQELEFLLAWDFRHSLIHATLWPSKDPRSLSFASYVNGHLIPSLKARDAMGDWKRSNSILDRLDPLAPTLLIFHSLDDILVRESDVLELKRLSTSQMQLYRHGGHLGYVWSERFRRDLSESLKVLRDSEQEPSQN